MRAALAGGRVRPGGPGGAPGLHWGRGGGRWRRGAPSGGALLPAGGGGGLPRWRALVGRAGVLPAPPRTHLVFGARTPAELYDLPALEKLAARWPWLTVTPAVSADSGFAGEQGTVADVVGRLARAPECDAYVCGSSAMTAATVSRLETIGVPREQIHFEDFGWSET